MCAGGGGSPPAAGEIRVSVASRRGNMTERPVIKNVLDGGERAGLISVLPRRRPASPAASPEIERFPHLNFRPGIRVGSLLVCARSVPAPRRTGRGGHDACKNYPRRRCRPRRRREASV